jgi:hypothetical protein
MRTSVIAVLVVVVLGGLAYGLPLVNESADTPCNALEKRFVAQATRPQPGDDPGATSFGRAVLGGLQGFTKGSVALEYVRREHPNLPAGVACVEEYWRSFFPKSEASGRPPA